MVDFANHYTFMIKYLKVFIERMYNFNDFKTLLYNCLELMLIERLLSLDYKCSTAVSDWEFNAKVMLFNCRVMIWLDVTVTETGLSYQYLSLSCRIIRLNCHIVVLAMDRLPFWISFAEL